MKFDYSKLSGKIKEVFDTQHNFSKAMKLSERSLSLKLSGKRTWKQPEIVKACELLSINDEEIHIYFFTRKEG